MRATALLAFALIGVLGSFTRVARADGPFVDRPLTLPPFHFAAGVGLGFGQGPGPATNPGSLTFGSTGVVIANTGTVLGWGSNFEAAVGLPFVGEVGVRVGVRFGQDGIDAGWGLGADHFARMFDPVVSEPGLSTVTNPEVHLRGTLLDLDLVEVALETRIVIPTDASSDLELTPGVPVRIHVPSFARIDTGIWLPIEFDSDTSFTIDIPAALFFQAGAAFFGPETGVRFNHPGGDVDSTTDVPAGLAGGYTLGGVLDLKVQVRTERINDSAWTRFIGGGLGVGLRLP